MASKFTATSIENIKAKATRQEIPDGLLNGFYLVIQPTGARGWAVRYRSPVDGKPKKHTIGAYPLFDLGKAREAARAALLAVAEGRDPAGEKQAARADAKVRGEGTGEDPDAIEAVFKRFVSRYAKIKTRPSTLQATEGFFAREVAPRWKGRRIQEITRKDVIALLDAIVDDGKPISANRTLAVIRKFFNWAIEQDIIAVSPAAGVKPPSAETSRDRTLTDCEIRLLWAACGKVGYPFGPMVKMLVLTGQRRDEVRDAKWAEFDLDARLWTIPGHRAKNGKAHTVPLAPQLIAEIEKLPKIVNERRVAVQVFSTTGETGVSGLSRAKARLDKLMLAEMQKDDAEAKLTPWTFHDLRRTAYTGLQRLGFSIEVTEATTNHISGTLRGVAKVYGRHRYENEKRAALEAWGRLVEAVVAGKTASVVPMVRAG